MLISTVGIDRPKNIPGLDDARKLIVTERQDVVKQLREAEANVRAARKAGDLKIVPKFEADMAAANKKIKFLDSRLANPNLAITYAAVKKTAQPTAPLPKKTQEKFGTFFGQEGVDKALKPTSFQNILLGDTDVQQLIQSGQKDFAKMTQNLQDKAGFGLLPKNMFFDFVRGALDPATYTEDLSNIFGNPAKFMDETFYNITDTSKSAGERAGAGLNFAFFVAGLIPGMKSLTKPAKEAFDNAAKAAFKNASIKGINVYEQIAKLNAAPETVARLTKLAAEAGIQKVKAQAKSTAVAVTKGLGKAGEMVGEAAVKAGKAAKTALDKIPLPETAVATRGMKPSRQAGFVNITINDMANLVRKFKSGSLFGTGDKEFDALFKKIIPDIDPTTGVENRISAIGTSLKEGAEETQFIRDLQEQLAKDPQTDIIAFGQNYQHPKATPTDPIIPPARVNELANQYKNKEIFLEPGQDIAVFFPQSLRTKIKQDLRKLDDFIAKSDFRNVKGIKDFGTWIQSNIFKFFSMAAPGTTQKRIFEARVPSLIPTTEIRKARIGAQSQQSEFWARQVKNVNDTLTDAVKNSQGFLDLKDAIINTKVKDLPNTLDNIAKANPELQPVVDMYKNMIEQAQGIKEVMPSARGLDDERTLYSILTSETAPSDKVFNLNKYLKLYDPRSKFPMAQDKILKVLDPIAILDNLGQRNIRKEVSREAIQEQAYLKNFFDEWIANEKENLVKQFEPNTVKQMQLLSNSLENVIQQVKQIDPQIDAEMKKSFGDFFDMLGKIVEKTSRSQIAANVSTGLAQLAPLPFSIAESGFVNTVLGLAKSLATPFDKDIFGGSRFLQARFSDNQQNALYKTVRDNYLKNGTIGEKLKALGGEKIIDNVTRLIINGMDKTMTKAVWAASYYKALDRAKLRGLTGTEAVKTARMFADYTTEKIIAGREAGALPAWFNSKAGQALFQYGLEVVNQPKVLTELASGKAGNFVQKAFNGVANITKYGVSAYLLNNLIENLSNRRPTFDPIGLIDDALKSKKETSETQIEAQKKLPGMLQRPASKSYTNPTQLFGKFVDNLTSINRIGEVSDLPITTIISDFRPFVEGVTSDTTYEDKKDMTNDFLLKLGAAFVKGGNQLRKTVTGIQGVAATYNDPKYTNLKGIPNWEDWSYTKFDKEAEKIIDKNKYEKASKSIKVQMGWDALKAILFGAKGTTEYRLSIAEGVDLKKMLKEANLELQRASNPRDEKLARKKIEDIQNFIREKNLRTSGGEMKPLPMPEDPEYKKQMEKIRSKYK